MNILKYKAIVFAALPLTLSTCNTKNAPADATQAVCNDTSHVEQKGENTHAAEPIEETKNDAQASKDQLPENIADTNNPVPNGWELKSQATGDLNKDGISDFAFITIPNFEENYVESAEEEHVFVNCNKPIIAIYWGKADGSYTKYKQFDNVFAPQKNYMKYDDLKVQVTKNGLLSFYVLPVEGLEYSVENTYLYRFQDNAFMKIGSETKSYARTEGIATEESYNYLTHKSIIKTHWTNGEQKTKVEKGNLPNDPLEALGTKTLKNF